MADGGADLGQFDDETDEDAEHKERDEYLEDPQPPHGAIWPVEGEDEERISDGNGTASRQGDLRGQDVQRDGCTDDLLRVISMVVRGQK